MASSTLEDNPPLLPPAYRMPITMTLYPFIRFIAGSKSGSSATAAP